MDLSYPLAYATFSELEQYCYRVASVVGLACLPIFGANHVGVQSYARNLGLALQLTNIIRDVKEDGTRTDLFGPSRICMPSSIPKRISCNSVIPQPSSP